MTPNNFRVKNGLTVSNGVTIEAGGLTITGGITANGSLGAAGQSLTSNGTAVYWGAGGKSAGDGLQANDTHYSVNTTWFDARTATITANNATYAFGKTEGNLNVNSAATATTANNATYAFGKSEADINANSALTANNASYVYGKQETQLNVNSATSASSANNASYLGGVAAADYQLESGLAANVATLAANTALTANNATYAFGKSEGDLNANSALTANNADYLDGQHGSYYTNATNITTGTLPEAQLPYRMNQDVRSSDTVTFGNITVTGNLTVSGTTVTVNANNLNIEDNMIYLNSGGANANPDLGWAGNYNDGTYAHAGMFRDASDSGIFKVFDQYVPEPDASPWLDTANATFRVADFQANTLYAAKLSANGSVGSNGNVLVSNGAGMYWGSVSGGIQYTVKTANYTASDKDGIIADTSGGAFTITLPSSPAAGAQVVIVDGSDFSTNNLTVGRNGSTIESTAEDLILDITGVSVTFIYSGTTWQVYTQVGASAASPTYKIVSTTYTAAARDNLVANTSGGSFTITLPASPSLGDEITIADGASFSTNPLTVARNGSTIEGLAENMVLDVSGIRTNFVYSGGTWQIFTQVGLGGLAYVDVANTANTASTANNALFLGGTAANGYQTTAGLAANVAILTANNTNFLGGTAANGYQTTAGLAANVATLASNTSLTANNANNLAGYTWGSPAAIGGTTANTAAFTNTTIVGTTTLQQTIEKAAVVASAATGTINFDVLTQAVMHYTTNASANWTINLRANSSTTFESLLAANQSLTVAFISNQGTTAYYPNVFQIDGSTRTVRWQGGTAPTAGNASSVDMYVYTVMKTAANTYNVYGAQTRFA